MELFNKYFVSVFKAPEIHDINPTEVTFNSFPSELTLTEDYVSKILCDLDTSKAVGLDSVSLVNLKACAQDITVSVCVLINISLADGKVPSEWL